MTHFEQFKNMSIDELAAWLDKHGEFDGSPWNTWWDQNYCSKCEPIECYLQEYFRPIHCSWCELEHKCKFFPDIDGIPGNNDVIKMWLQTTVQD